MRTDLLAPVIISLVLLSACVTPLPDRTVVDQKGPVETEQPAIAPAVTPARSVAQTILLRDPGTGAVASVAELADGAPVLLDLSASWCGPCAELTPRLDQVAARTGGTVRFFMVLQSGDSPDRQPFLPSYPVYFLERAPADLAIDPPEIMPTVLVLDREGAVAAVMEGLYPTLYYLGIVSDVSTTGQMR